MYVDNNGIVRFENLDDITPLQTNLNAALESVSNQFDSANLDERVAELLELPQGDARSVITSIIADPSQEQFPFKMIVGRINISATDGAGEGTVTFPAGFFTDNPRVFVTAVSGVSNTQNVQLASGASTSSVTIRLIRSSTASTGIDWMAIQV